MKKHARFMLCLWACLFICCTNKSQADRQEPAAPTAAQEELRRHGWTQDIPESGDLGEAYGIKPVYGIQDNYFNISIGAGFSVAIKIVDAENNRPVRYVYVPECETVTVNQIPQGMYFLKLAYGKDWMQCDNDSITLGRFTRDAFYEKSAQAYDFGRKNSQSIVNYTLEINIVNGEAEHEFKTTPITEEEFERN